MGASARFELEFSIRRAWLPGGAFLVAPAGELDAVTVPELAEALLEVDASARLIVDLTDVTFLDSTALGALAGETKTRRRAGGELLLACDDGRTRRVLAATGLDGVLAVHRTLRDALEAKR